MSSSLEKSAKSSLTLVRFQYGSPAVQQLYCDNSSEETGYGGIYAPTPSLEFEDIEVSGLLKEKLGKITLPADAFTSWLASDRPHPRVFCWVFDRTGALDSPAGEEPTKTIFRGEVFTATNNPEGKNGQVQIDLVNWKSQMDLKVGLVETHICNWSWGSPSCTINPDDWVETATIDAVSGKTITVSDTAVTTKTDRFWRGGWVEVAGAHIRIKDWVESASGTLYMQKQVPVDWAGASADFFPGDDKTYKTCKNKYGNNNKFEGIGVGIPYYQPVLQTPRTG